MKWRKLLHHFSTTWLGFPVVSAVLWPYRRGGSWGLNHSPAPPAYTQALLSWKETSLRRPFCTSFTKTDTKGADVILPPRLEAVGSFLIFSQCGLSLHPGVFNHKCCWLLIKSSWTNLATELAPSSWTVSLNTSLTLPLPGSISLEGHTCLPHPLFFLHIHKKCAPAAKPKIVIFNQG